MQANTKNSNWEIEVFYDGECPLCRREISMLRWMDRKQRILFTDIAGTSFQPQVYGKNLSELMAEIHGRLPDKTWVIGVEVFRRLYSAVGFSLIAKVTRLPLLSHALNLGYRLFAKHRLSLTGRCKPQGDCKIKQ